MSIELRGNPYIQFDLFLDPAETDPKKLVDLLRSKSSEWNKKINFDEKYGVLLNDARGWLRRLDPPGNNAVSRSDLLKLASEARQERLLQLQRAIVEVERDGVLEQTKYDYLLEEFFVDKKKQRKYFDESTIKSEIHLPITTSKPKEKAVIPTKPGLPPGVHEISRAEMDKLDQNLKVYNDRPGNKFEQKDLFQLLEGTPKTDAATLLGKADELYINIYQKAAKKTIYIDALGKILGQAKIYFKSEETKESYQLALARRPFDALCASRFHYRAIGNSVSRDAYLLSIEEARECGLSKEWSEWYVYEYYCVKPKKCDYPLSNAVSVLDKGKETQNATPLPPDSPIPPQLTNGRFLQAILAKFIFFYSWTKKNLAPALKRCFETRRKMVVTLIVMLLLVAGIRVVLMSNSEKKTLKINGIDYTFCWCPAGSFMMGNPEDEEYRSDVERQHKVSLTEGFWLLEHEVTQEMWKSMMGENPS